MYLLILPVLILLTFWEMSSWYYQFIRWISFVLFLNAAHTTLQSKQAGFGLLLLTLACLYNPIFQFYFPRYTWILIDIAAIIATLSYGIFINTLKESTKNESII